MYLYSDTCVLRASPMTSYPRRLEYMKIHCYDKIRFCRSPLNLFAVFRYSVTLPVVCIGHNSTWNVTSVGSMTLGDTEVSCRL
jgi:hypothetical protein